MLDILIRFDYVRFVPRQHQSKTFRGYFPRGKNIILIEENENCTKCM